MNCSEVGFFSSSRTGKSIRFRIRHIEVRIFPPHHPFMRSARLPKRRENGPEIRAFRAFVNSRDNNFTQGKIKRRQKQIEESVARYMSQLDTADRRTAAGEDPSEAVLLTKTRLKEKLAKLEEEVKRLAAIEKALLASPDKQISLTDPDCRSMATSDCISSTGQVASCWAKKTNRSVESVVSSCCINEVETAPGPLRELGHDVRCLVTIRGKDGVIGRPSLWIS
jgi:hypothetical protein